MIVLENGGGFAPCSPIPLPAPRSQPCRFRGGRLAVEGGGRLTFRTDPSSPPFPEKLYLALSVGLDI